MTKSWFKCTLDAEDMTHCGAAEGKWMKINHSVRCVGTSAELRLKQWTCSSILSANVAFFSNTAAGWKWAYICWLWLVAQCPLPEFSVAWILQLCYEFLFHLIPKVLYDCTDQHLVTVDAIRVHGCT